MGRLDDKVAIITGAGAGIGQATAILFAREGAKVVVAELVAERGEETVNMIKEAGGEAMFVKTNVTKSKDIKHMVRVTVDTYGKLDILFNNAAIAPKEFILESKEDTFEKVMDINVKGTWLGMKYAIPEMIKSGGGSIINAASIAADHGQRGLSIYSASKGAVISMSRVVAVEHAADNVRVNAIKPGVIATAMATTHSPEIIRGIEKATPQGRLGKPEEIAYGVLFLASDESSHMTGQNLTLDGGIEGDSHLM